MAGDPAELHVDLAGGGDEAEWITCPITGQRAPPPEDGQDHPCKAKKTGGLDLTVVCDGREDMKCQNLPRELDVAMVTSMIVSGAAGLDPTATFRMCAVEDTSGSNPFPDNAMMGSLGLQMGVKVRLVGSGGVQGSAPSAESTMDDINLTVAVSGRTMACNGLPVELTLDVAMSIIVASSADLDPSRPWGLRRPGDKDPLPMDTKIRLLPLSSGDLVDLVDLEHPDAPITPSCLTRAQADSLINRVGALSKQAADLQKIATTMAEDRRTVLLAVVAIFDATVGIATEEANLGLSQEAQGGEDLRQGSAKLHHLGTELKKASAQYASRAKDDALADAFVAAIEAVRSSADAFASVVDTYAAQVDAGSTGEENFITCPITGQRAAKPEEGQDHPCKAKKTGGLDFAVVVEGREDIPVKNIPAEIDVASVLQMMISSAGVDGEKMWQLCYENDPTRRSFPGDYTLDKCGVKSGDRILLCEREDKDDGLRKCSISPAQVEEVFERSDAPVRKATMDWCLRNKEASAAFFKVSEGGEARPERWQIRTLDTCRFVDFSWRPLEFRVVPRLFEEAKLNDLFRIAMATLQMVAVPMNVMMARYERTTQGRVVAVHVPLPCLVRFAEAQVRMDELELAAKKEGAMDSETEKAISQINKSAREFWKKQGVADGIYRELAHAVLQIRCEQDPPFLVLSSTMTHDYVVAVCRHCDLITEDFHKSLPGLSRKQFIMWPLADHSADADAPFLFCNARGCQKHGGRPADPVVMGTYENHIGPHELGIKAEIKRRTGELWSTEFLPKVDAEVEAGGDSDEVRQKYDELFQEEEVRIRKEVDKESCVPLMKCGYCKEVSYCSKDCQKADWGRHKKVCSKKKK